MNPIPRVMLLIDADNVSTDVIEQAISRLHAEYGALHVRRAYGTAENAVKHQRLFKRLSIRPIVNLAAGKNSTDIALAVDALDLVITERPEVVVIASSDSDFAPLVSRIREKGCIVRGVGQKGKVGEETPLIYDDFLEFEHRGSRSRPTSEEPMSATRTTRSKRGGAGRGSSARDRAAAEPAPAKGRRAATVTDKAAAAPPIAEAPPAPAEAPRRRTAGATGAASGTARKASSRKTTRAAAQEPLQASADTAAQPPGVDSPVAGPRDLPVKEKPARKAARKRAPKANAEASEPAPEPVASVPAIDGQPEPATEAPAPRKTARRTRKSSAEVTAADSPAAAPPPVAAEPAAPAAPAKKAARKSATRKAAAAPPAPPMPEKVARALEVLPGLAAGHRMDVQNAAAVLRKERVFSNSDSWPKFFDRYKDWFELLPADRPTHVRRREPA